MSAFLYVITFYPVLLFQESGRKQQSPERQQTLKKKKEIVWKLPKWSTALQYVIKKN